MNKYIVMIALLVAFAVGATWYVVRSRVRATPAPERQRLDLAPSVATPRDPADTFDEVDLPGESSPRLVSASDANISVSDVVIGISVNGQHRAYTIRALSRVDQHAVNDLFGNVPVTVTYCDLRDCVRVFTSDDDSERLGIGVSGYRRTKNGGLILSHKGKQFRQEGDDLPFGRMKFERMRWLDWVAAHPDTLLYDGARPEEEGDESQ